MKCCDCGSYECTVSFPMPDCWKTTRDQRIISCDVCIAYEIMDLVKKGIRTLASCCGHGKYISNVIVAEDEESISNMENLGYKHSKSLKYLNRDDIFVLKTKVNI